MKRPRHFWTTTELARLRLEYPTSTYHKLLASFPQQTRGSIISAARRLGIKRVFVKPVPKIGRKKWKTITDSHVYQTPYFG